MKRNLLFLFIVFTVFFSAISLHGQTNENIWFDGLSRSYFARDAIDKNTTKYIMIVGGLAILGIII